MSGSVKSWLISSRGSLTADAAGQTANAATSAITGASRKYRVLIGDSLDIPGVSANAVTGKRGLARAPGSGRFDRRPRGSRRRMHATKGRGAYRAGHAVGEAEGAATREEKP